MAVKGLLFLKHDPQLVPTGGYEVLASLAAPIKNLGKDAAGHRFHEYALRQAGFFGEHSFQKRAQFSTFRGWTVPSC